MLPPFINTEQYRQTYPPSSTSTSGISDINTVSPKSSFTEISTLKSIRAVQDGKAGSDSGSSGKNAEAGPSAPPISVSKAGQKSTIVLYGPAMEIEMGCLAGKRIRFSLSMEQEPIHGRRKTDKDRRPIAHCPILRLRMLECRQSPSGGYEEIEIDVSGLEPGNFVCAAQLSPPISPTGRPVDQLAEPLSSLSIPSDPISNTDKTEQDVLMASPTTSSAKPSASTIAEPGTNLKPPTRPQPPRSHHSSNDPTPRSSPSGSSHTGTRNPTPSLPLDSLAKAQTFAESSVRTSKQRTAANRSSGSSGDGREIATQHAKKKTRQVHPRNLYGGIHVPAVRVIAPEGDLGIWFLFTDLTVRQEGTYFLKFRVFDITAVESSSNTAAPVLADAKSQYFRVYSPRNFPGLPKPTELADHLGRQGFKLNTRKNERQAVSPPPGIIIPPPAVPPRPPPQPMPTSGSSQSGSATSREREQGQSDSARPDAKPLQPRSTGQSPTMPPNQSGSTVSTTSGSSSASSSYTLSVFSQNNDRSAASNERAQLGQGGSGGSSSLNGGASSGSIGKGPTIPSPLSREYPSDQGQKK